MTGEEVVGGLVGEAVESLFVNCYSVGSVTGGAVGGLVGHGRAIEILDCYSASRLSAPQHVAGLLGQMMGDRSRVTGSFWDAEISDLLDAAGLAGKTTAQMQDPNTFMEVGWDFVGKPHGPSDVWAEPPGGGYPILWWQLAELPELPFAGGTGSPDAPYLIATAEQLNRIGYNPRIMDAHFRLVDDIDLSGVHFHPIGSAKYPYPFAGVFDGGNFTISHFTHVAAEPENIGLFRMVSGEGAEVRNVRLLNPVVDGADARSVGSLIGWLERGIIRNCHVEGGWVSGRIGVGGLVGGSGNPLLRESGILAQIVSCSASIAVVGQWTVGGLVGTSGMSTVITDCHADSSVDGTGGNVGGLVGVNDQAIIVNCHSRRTATGKQAVGGLVGRNHLGTVQRSFSTANVQGDAEIGGLVGFNHGSISDCYAIAAIAGRDKVGGLVGRNGFIGPQGQDAGMVSNSYSAGRISGTQNAGGLIGYNEFGSALACFWDINTSGLSTRPGGAAKTTAEMQTASTFLSAGWDFVSEVDNGTEDIWWILDGQDYPRLSWEQVEWP